MAKGEAASLQRCVESARIHGLTRTLATASVQIPVLQVQPVERFFGDQGLVGVSAWISTLVTERREVPSLEEKDSSISVPTFNKHPVSPRAIPCKRGA